MYIICLKPKKKRDEIGKVKLIQLSVMQTSISLSHHFYTWGNFRIRRKKLKDSANVATTKMYFRKKQQQAKVPKVLKFQKVKASFCSKVCASYTKTKQFIT